ncbi:snRNA-activating complex subunit 4 [Gossypium australe]|uniref:snRNA-activating complex subunit 4 n=1 Tax=Gossypium australe TaxID=47621 RepID=A0A5B6U2N4_9ROSI|nr:snRNA-activating complex subunit 4 [Gossypium australe]
MRDTSALLPSSYRHTMKSNKHEADGDRHVDGKNHGAYENTGSGQDKDNSSSGDANADADGMDNGNVNGDARVGVCDDKVNDRDEEKGDDDVARCVRGKHADCIVVDWLNGEYCFECNSGSGQVLVCSESGCPVALHEACMTWRPMFDDMERSGQVQRLDDRSYVGKEGIVQLICLRRDSRNKEREGETVSMKGASVSTMAREVSCGDCRNGLNDDGKETRHHSQDSTRGVDVIRKNNPMSKTSLELMGLKMLGTEKDGGS